MKPTSHHGDDHLYGAESLHNEDVAHEHSDVNVRQLLAYTVGLVAMCVFSAIAMWGLFNFLEGQAAKNDPQLSPHAIPAGQLPPEPRIMTNEPEMLEKHRKEQAQSLGEYGWVDQPGGAARLPIADAKKKLLERGLPVRLDAPEDAWIGTNSAARGESSSGRAIPLKPASAGAATDTAKPAGAQKPPVAVPHKGH